MGVNESWEDRAAVSGVRVVRVSGLHLLNMVSTTLGMPPLGVCASFLEIQVVPVGKIWPLPGKIKNANQKSGTT